MAVSLEGFYYDAEKKKYFRILPHHQAPNGAKYSKEALSQTTKLKEKRRKWRLTRTEMPPFYRPSSILSHELLGRTGLQRELGLKPGNTRDPLLAWASGLERKVSADYYYADILDFVIDNEIGCTIQVFPGPSPDSMLAIHAARPNVRRNDIIDTPPTRFGRPIHSSISLSPSRVLIATSRGEHNMSKLHFMKLADPDRFNPGPPERWRLLGDGGSLLSCDPTPEKPEWFSSAAKPDLASTVFVVGGVLGAGVSTLGQGGWDWECSNPNSTSDDKMNPVFSVDWLNSNIFISGNGAGCVCLTDARIRETALRFKHPAAIIRVKNLGEDKIIVAGLSNALMSYDIRSPAPQSFDQPTKAYMEFSGYEWGDDPTIVPGFDVHENLVATASGEFDVKLFNTATGREVPMGFTGRDRPALRKRVRTLKFAPDLWDKTRLDDGYGLRLFATVGASIEQWSFSNKEVGVEYERRGFEHQKRGPPTRRFIENRDF